MLFICQLQSNESIFPTLCSYRENPETTIALLLRPAPMSNHTAASVPRSGTFHARPKPTNISVLKDLFSSPPSSAVCYFFVEDGASKAIRVLDECVRSQGKLQHLGQHVEGSPLRSKSADVLSRGRRCNTSGAQLTLPALILVAVTSAISVLMSASAAAANTSRCR